ncbi:MAG: hypothetical protein DRQ49_06120 [Gammaproteobacteria bacterium]|nr:MAG: hypothetical protein DRQ49_06120 [Gammaproteobacteria bacterium]
MMKRKLSRRAFIISSTVGIFAVATGIITVKSGYLNTHDRMTKTIFAVFEKRLSYLKWDKAQVMSFIKDFITHTRNKGYLKKVRSLSFFYPLYAHSNLLERTSLASKLHNFEERIITKFLLSTSFFREGADETKPVKYLSYYDPYKMPCKNPFAQWL